MDIGGENYTNFRAVRLRSSAALRLVGSGGEATFSVSHLEADRAYSFPDKSGRFPIMGTFAVQLPAATANVFSTIVTVSGIRTEDGLVVMPNRGVSAGYNFIAAATYYILLGATPGAGNIELFFRNAGNATAYLEQVYSFAAVR